jgi:single-strand DNA-binding protein
MSTSPTNSTNLIGYFAGDPTLKTLPTGTSVAELRVGVSQAGNSRDDAGFFDVAVYGKAGEAAAKYLRKGSHVAVHGTLQHRTWKAKDDTSRSAVRIVGNVQFLDRKTSDDEHAAAAIAASIPADVAPQVDDIPF